MVSGLSVKASCEVSSAGAVPGNGACVAEAGSGPCVAEGNGTFAAATAGGLSAVARKGPTLLVCLGRT